MLFGIHSIDYSRFPCPVAFSTISKFVMYDSTQTCALVTILGLVVSVNPMHKELG